MASVVDICNLALSHIGQDGVVTDIDPPDGTLEADYCEQFYPIARDELLEMHAWKFATFRKALAKLTVNELEGQWRFAYGMPTLVIKTWLVLPPESADDKDAVPFEVEAQEDGTLVIYTNQEDAVLKYTKLITDTTKYSPGFTSALSYRLAQYLAGPITKRPEVVASMEDKSNKRFVLASAADASSRRKDILRNHQPGHLNARKV